MKKIEYSHIAKAFMNLEVNRDLYFDTKTNIENEMRLKDELNEFNQKIMANEDTHIKERIERDLSIINDLIERGFKINIPYITCASERDNTTRWATLLSQNIIMGKGKIKIYSPDYMENEENGFFYKGRGAPEQFANALSNYLVTITSLAFEVKCLNDEDIPKVKSIINNKNREFFEQMMKIEIDSLNGKKMSKLPNFLTPLKIYGFMKNLIDEVSKGYFEKITDFSDIYHLMGIDLENNNPYVKNDFNKILVSNLVEGGIRNIYQEESSHSSVMSFMAFVKAYKENVLDENVFKDIDVFESIKSSLYTLYLERKSDKDVWQDQQDASLEFIINFAKHGHRLSWDCWTVNESFFVDFWKKFLTLNEKENLRQPEITKESLDSLNHFNKIKVHKDGKDLVLLDMFFKKEELLLNYILSHDVDKTGQYELIIKEKDFDIINASMFEVRNTQKEQKEIKEICKSLLSGSIIVDVNTPDNAIKIKIDNASEQYLMDFVKIMLSCFVTNKNKDIYSDETVKLNKQSFDDKSNLLRENMLNSMLKENNQQRIKRKI